jgi:hypothetical protein
MQFLSFMAAIATAILIAFVFLEPPVTAQALFFQMMAAAVGWIAAHVSMRHRRVHAEPKEGPAPARGPDRCQRCGENLMYGAKGDAVGSCVEHRLVLCRACLIDHDVEVHGVSREEAERDLE